VPAAGGRGPEQRLRRDAADPRDPRQVVGQATVDRLRGRLDSQQRGGQVHQRPLGDYEQVGAQAPEAGGHAPLDAEEQGHDSEDRARPQRDGQRQERRARRPPAESL
jgi:hypothetical protein